MKASLFLCDTGTIPNDVRINDFPSIRGDTMAYMMHAIQFSEMTQPVILSVKTIRSGRQFSPSCPAIFVNS